MAGQLRNRIESIVGSRRLLRVDERRRRAPAAGERGTADGSGGDEKRADEAAHGVHQRGFS